MLKINDVTIERVKIFLF